MRFGGWGIERGGSEGERGEGRGLLGIVRLTGRRLRPFRSPCLLDVRVSLLIIVP